MRAKRTETNTTYFVLWGKPKTVSYDISLNFSIFPDISMTTMKFPDFCRFFFQVSGHPVTINGAKTDKNI